MLSGREIESENYRRKLWWGHPYPLAFGAIISCTSLAIKFKSYLRCV